MKKIYFLLLTGLVAVSSCDQLLNIDAENTIGGDVLKNTERIEQALNGAYYSLGGFSDGNAGGELLGGDFIIIPTLMAYEEENEIFWTSSFAPTYTDFINKNILSTNARVQQNWLRAYEVINIVNTILAKLDEVADQATRNRIEGECKAIRGLLYFEMNRLWAPQYGTVANTTLSIPLILTPFLDVNDITTPQRATIEAVYNQAEQDLLQAASLLQPSGKNGTRINFYACHAYLMRLYMQKNDYSRALTQAELIMSSGQYALNTSPLQAFNNTTNSPEDIFSIQQTLANNAGDRTTGTGITHFYSSLTESGLGIFVVLSTTFRRSAFTSFGFFNSPRFSSTDIRGSIDTTATPATSAAQINTAFYNNLSNNFSVLVSPAKYKRADHVIPVIRLAEVQLSRAEALFEANPNVINTTALNDLNAVRTRAGLPSLVVGDFVDADAFYDSLVLERKRELIFEGHLLHDLRRWRAYLNDNSIIIGSTLFTPAVRRNPLRAQLILPIPQAEIDTWTD